MDINELYVLNSALDENDIPMLPERSKLGISNMMLYAVKDRMIESGLLSDENTFTDEGLLLTERLRHFKKAKKHIRVNNMFFTSDRATDNILIIFNPLFNEYYIKKVDAFDEIELLELYEIKSDDAYRAEEWHKPLECDKVTSEYTLTQLNTMTVEILLDKKSSKEMYFKNNGHVFIYDFYSKTLHSTTYRKMVQHLNERIRKV